MTGAAVPNSSEISRMFEYFAHCDFRSNVQHQFARFAHTSDLAGLLTVSVWEQTVEIAPCRFLLPPNLCQVFEQGPRFRDAKISIVILPDVVDDMAVFVRQLQAGFGRERFDQLWTPVIDIEKEAFFVSF
jgi:hypothetical protein